MIRNRVVTLAAIGLGAGALALAGCGSSSDTASTAADTAAASTDTTASTPTTASTAIPCIGAEEACSAKVPIGGGASNKTVQIELTGTNMGEPEVTVDDPQYEGSYSISDGTFTTGGSIYQFTLNSVESIPAGVNIEMTFAQKK